MQSQLGPWVSTDMEGSWGEGISGSLLGACVSVGIEGCKGFRDSSGVNEITVHHDSLPHSAPCRALTLQSARQARGASFVARDSRPAAGVTPNRKLSAGASDNRQLSGHAWAHGQPNAPAASGFTQLTLS